jgi:biofilm PGA synthesis N-glycosyltransferase PgaC
MLLLVCIIILSLYFIQWMKWHTAQAKEESGYQYIPDCTIIVPFRNEEKNLPRLLHSLHRNFPERWRIILVDDQSEDRSCEAIAPYINFQTQLLQSKGEGKKVALRTGIEHAYTPWIVTMDADLILSPGWEATLYKSDWSSDMIIFSMGIEDGYSNLAHWQQIEFSIFQYLTQKSCYKGQPQLCNGAFLGFKRRSFIQVGGYESHEEIASGDDQFLLASFRQHDKKITFHSTQEKAHVSGVRSFRELIQQRLRWAEKSKDLPLADMRQLGMITLLANAVALLLPWITSPLIVIGLLMLKWLPEYFAIAQKLRSSLRLFTIFFLITYPVWVLMVAIGIVIFPIEWKGRRIT